MTDRDPRERSTPQGASLAIRTQFFLAFLAAGAGSFLFSILGSSWLPGVWGAVCMLAFWALARYRTREHVETEEFADNFYFLGFLLTLVSLFGLFVQLGRKVTTTLGDDLLRTVLSQFGLALITTIVGLVVRTLILMSRPTAKDIEERAEGRVNRAFDEFTRSLNRLTAEANAFSHSFGKQLETYLLNIEQCVSGFAEAVRTTSESLKPVREDLADFSGALKTSVNEIRSAAAELVGALMASKGELALAFSEFKQSVGEASKEVRSYSAGLAQVVTSVEDDARKPVQALHDKLEGFGRELDGLLQSLERIPTQLSESTERFNSASERFASELGEIGRRIQDLENTIRSVATAVDPDRTGLTGSLQALRSRVEELSALHAQLTEEAQGASDTIVRIRREIAAGVNFLVETLTSDNGERAARG